MRLQNSEFLVRDMKACLWAVLLTLVLIGCAQDSKPAIEVPLSPGTDTQTFYDVSLNKDTFTPPTSDIPQTEDKSDLKDELCPKCGEPCTDNADCDDGVNQGWCVQVDEDGTKECTVSCVDECPPDYSCVTIQNAGTDGLLVCMPHTANDCEPCKADADCVYENSKCVAIGQVDGAADLRCALACSGNSDCAEGYECKGVTDGEGNDATRCVPKTGSCVCFGNNEEGKPINGSTRACESKNDIGSCLGLETCKGELGWTDCSAEPATEEVCDGKDNDCDGTLDEDSPDKPCENKNEHGVCKGTNSCDGANGWVCDALVPEEEVCDGQDNNCDDLVDEGYPDDDGDGIANCMDNDTDGDGVVDGKDNCPEIANANQADIDEDKKGDVCDSDKDGDAVPNDTDNCPETPNPQQDDLDDDGQGDDCDPDKDGDGSKNAEDCAPEDKKVFPNATEVCDGIDNNCNSQVDEGSGDADNDGLADCLDDDDDGDTILDEADNCPLDSNKSQADMDQDGIGDACDSDIDGDGYDNAKDCDPKNKEAYPGAKEICDGLDNDCNKQVDEGFPDPDNDNLANCIDDDDDNDGIKDDSDNCPEVKNTDQSDLDKDQLGDLCDDDMDGDGYSNSTDCAPKDKKAYPDAEEVCDGIDNNCNNQTDEGFPDPDNDNLANCVDDDDDNDGIKDEDDNCPEVPNKEQKDLDKDGVGDACELDSDGDGVTDDVDNCPTIKNPEQKDNDNDKAGDICDPDDDNDTVIDTKDNCPILANPQQIDTDNDTKGNACDPDDDNDTVKDGVDNCPLTSNKPQKDTDGDKKGDACDSDDDNDGIFDGEDNCPLIPNSDQKNNDKDGLGDICDDDDDDDTVQDTLDNCPVDANKNQQDTDNDKQGDACDDDDDGDGTPDLGGDCQPLNKFIHPNALELCDGVDNNCNGLLDDGIDDPDRLKPCDGNDPDLCLEGKLQCVGGKLECDDPGDFDADLCDGVDNDCNPDTEDGIDEQSKWAKKCSEAIFTDAQTVSNVGDVVTVKGGFNSKTASDYIHFSFNVPTTPEAYKPRIALTEGTGDYKLAIYTTCANNGIAYSECTDGFSEAFGVTAWSMDFVYKDDASQHTDESTKHEVVTVRVFRSEITKDCVPYTVQAKLVP